MAPGHSCVGMHTHASAMSWYLGSMTNLNPNPNLLLAHRLNDEAQRFLRVVTEREWDEWAQAAHTAADSAADTWRQMVRIEAARAMAIFLSESGAPGMEPTFDAEGRMVAESPAGRHMIRDLGPAAAREELLAAFGKLSWTRAEVHELATFTQSKQAQMSAWRSLLETKELASGMFLGSALVAEDILVSSAVNLDMCVTELNSILSGPPVDLPKNVYTERIENAAEVVSDAYRESLFVREFAPDGDKFAPFLEDEARWSRLLLASALRQIEREASDV